MVHLSNTFENSKSSYIHSSLLLFLVFTVFTVFTSNASAYVVPSTNYHNASYDGSYVSTSLSTYSGAVNVHAYMNEDNCYASDVVHLQHNGVDICTNLCIYLSFQVELKG